MVVIDSKVSDFPFSTVKKKMGCPAQECTIEFRSYANDAWYSVRLVTEGMKLRVKYENFPEDHDQVFDTGSFKSLAEFEDFRSRLRRVSIQVQDQDCPEVSIGKHLCASHAFSSSDLRFYDAIVEEVHRKEHTFTNGEEVCLCKFLLCWQHGPNAGTLAKKNVENICFVQVGVEVEPSLLPFLEMVWKKLANPSNRTDSGSIVNSDEVNNCQVIKPLSFSQRQEESAKWSSGKTCAFEDTAMSRYDREDVDMGEVKDPHAIFIQNIEKDLSSSAIMEFVRKKTLIDCQACVLPSLSWEPSTKGLIILDRKSDFHKLVHFLQDPTHMIVSSRGRPWVVVENMSTKDAGSLLLKRLARTNQESDELKVVVVGTKEYERAKEQRDLFIEFVHHQGGVYTRFQMLTQEMSNLEAKPVILA